MFPIASILPISRVQGGVLDGVGGITVSGVTKFASRFVGAREKDNLYWRYWYYLELGIVMMSPWRRQYW